MSLIDISSRTAFTGIIKFIFLINSCKIFSLPWNSAITLFFVSSVYEKHNKFIFTIIPIIIIGFAIKKHKFHEFINKSRTYEKELEVYKVVIKHFSKENKLNVDQLNEIVVLKAISS